MGVVTSLPELSEWTLTAIAGYCSFQRLSVDFQEYRR